MTVRLRLRGLVDSAGLSAGEGRAPARGNLGCLGPRPACALNRTTRAVECGIARDDSQEIAAEFARRYRLRPRAAHRHAFGWTLTQAADRINAYAAELGDQTAGGAGANAQPFAQRLSGDRTLALLPMQHVLGAGPVKLVLPACLTCGLA